MKIVYLPQDFDGAGHYRLIYPLSALEAEGEIVAEPFPIDLKEPNATGDGWITVFNVNPDEVPVADLYILQRPIDKHLQWVIGELQKRAPVIVEIDDNYLSIPTHNQAFAGTSANWRLRARQYAERNGKSKLTKQEILQIAYDTQTANRNNVHQALHLADAVTVSTPFLKSLYQRQHVYVLRNWLRWADWADLKPFRGRRFTIGYTGAAKWKRGDAAILGGLIGPWLERHPDAVFYAAGDPELLKILEIPEGQGDLHPRVGFPAHTRFYGNMHLGLIPLQRNSFNQGKSWLTGMEMNAAWVPTVASPLDSYYQFAEKGGLVTIAERPADWTRAWDQAYENFHSGETAEIQNTARACAEDFRVESHLAVILDTYKEVCRRYAKERSRKVSSQKTSPPQSPRTSAGSFLG